MVLGLLVIMAAGSIMIGDIVPHTKSPESGQSVIISKPWLAPSHSNLQLEYFPGATLTPTPTPTVPPQPQQDTSGSGGGGNDNGGGGGGSGSCFPKGTKIAMVNGEPKNIEDVKVGDKIVGFDGIKQVAETVLQLESPIRDHLYKLSFKDGTILELTREHPLFTANGWESISPESTAQENPNLITGTLRVGDAVMNTAGNFIEITSIEYIPGKVQTYNLRSVSGFNNYYAGGKLAHNKGSCFVKGTQIF